MRGSFKLALACAFSSLVFSSCSKSSSGGGKKPITVKGTVIETENKAVVLGEDWFNLSPELDNKEGQSINRVYSELLSGQDLEEVVVAVIDSGVDIHHEDLKSRIWKNPGETGMDSSGKNKETNGVDDDRNGFIDDVHGWNFLGGKDTNGNPTHVDAETLEKTRIFRNLQAKIDAGQTLKPEMQALYEKVKNEVTTEKTEAEEELKVLVPAIATIETAYPTIAGLLDNKPVDAITRDEVAALEIDAAQTAQIQAKDDIVNAMDSAGFTSVARMKRFVGIDEDAIKYNLNVEFDARAEIVKDNPDNFNSVLVDYGDGKGPVHYGNNDVIGPDASHGTHVSGIIAAERDNGIGINGVAQSAKIMVLRAVPNGDETDKDVSLAIRYAAKHGAKVINMSFGKAYSPHRFKVEQAIRYAESMGVLLVHAAGNDAKNTTEDKSNFPTPEKLGSGERFESWVEIGASSAIKGPSLPAVFSNYGTKSVDIFAPGVKIESTVPGSQYAVFSGTSMASPSFAGAAALILSLNPEMTAKELKTFMMNTGRSYGDLKVSLPGAPANEILFSELSITGKISDAFSALSTLIN